MSYGHTASALIKDLRLHTCTVHYIHVLHTELVSFTITLKGFVIIIIMGYIN